MKKLYPLGKKVYLGLFLLLLVSGCSSTGNSEDVVSSVVNGFGENVIITQPDRVAEVIGIIKSIAGNEAIVAIVDVPESETEGGEETSTGAALTGGTTRIPGMGGGGGGGDGSGGGDKEAMIAEKLKNSKENVTVSIPVGVLMTKRESSGVEGSGPIVTEANLSDVKSGKMVSIWLNQNISDRKIAEFVSLR